MGEGAPQVTLPVGTGQSVTVNRGDVLLIEGKEGTVTWITGTGHFVHYGAQYAVQSLALLGEHHGFIAIGAGRWLNRERLSSIRWSRPDKCYWLTIDSAGPGAPGDAPGPMVIRMHPAMGKKLAATMGLPHLYHVEPLPEVHRHLLEEGLRDYPREIFIMGAPELRGYFETGGAIDEELLVRTMAWQFFRWRCLGRRPSYEMAIPRGFIYRPVCPVLVRLGLGSRDGRVPGVDEREEVPPPRAEEEPEPPPDGDPSERTVNIDYYTTMLLRILVDLSAERRLFTYRDLGLADARPDLRRIGARRPAIVLVVEKYSLIQVMADASERFGISGIVLGGNPSWISTEHFCWKLLEALGGERPVRLITLVDYDPFGWLLAGMFRDQLERYGISTGSMKHLVLPAMFTAEEIAAVSYPVESTSAAISGKIKKWMASGGGINGEPRGIHADDLWPHERIFEALEKECRRAPRRGREGGRGERGVVTAPAYGSMEGPLFAAGLDRLVLQGSTATGLVFLDPREVSLVEVEHAGRLALVTTAGEVFHLSRPLAYVAPVLTERCPGFVQVSPGALVNRAHVVAVRPVAPQRWEVELPGGWTAVMEPENVVGGGNGKKRRG